MARWLFPGDVQAQKKHGELEHDESSEQGSWLSIKSEFGGRVAPFRPQKWNCCCGRHPHRSAQLYCITCSSGVCSDCRRTSAEHRHHSLRRLDFVAKLVLSDLDADVLRVSQRVDEFRASLEHIQHHWKKLLHNVHTSQTTIQTDLWKLGVEDAEQKRRLNTVLGELEAWRWKEQTKVEVHRTKCELALSTLSCFVGYSRELMTRGQFAEVTSSVPELHDIADRLLQFYVTPDAYQAPRVAFSVTKSSASVSSGVRTRELTTRRANHLIHCALTDSTSCWRTCSLKVRRLDKSSLKRLKPSFRSKRLIYRTPLTLLSGGKVFEKTGKLFRRALKVAVFGSSKSLKRRVALQLQHSSRLISITSFAGLAIMRQVEVAARKRRAIGMQQSEDNSASTGDVGRKWNQMSSFGQNEAELEGMCSSSSSSSYSASASSTMSDRLSKLGRRSLKVMPRDSPEPEEVDPRFRRTSAVQYIKPGTVRRTTQVVTRPISREIRSSLQVGQPQARQPQIRLAVKRELVVSRKLPTSTPPESEPEVANEANKKANYDRLQQFEEATITGTQRANADKQLTSMTQSPEVEKHENTLYHTEVCKLEQTSENACEMGNIRQKNLLKEACVFRKRYTTTSNGCRPKEGTNCDRNSKSKKELKQRQSSNPLFIEDAAFSDEQERYIPGEDKRQAYAGDVRTLEIDDMRHTPAADVRHRTHGSDLHTSINDKRYVRDDEKRHAPADHTRQAADDDKRYTSNADNKRHTPKHNKCQTISGDRRHIPSVDDKHHTYGDDVHIPVDDKRYTPDNDKRHTPADDRGRTPVADDKRRTPNADKSHTPGGDDKHHTHGDDVHTPVDDKRYTPDNDKRHTPADDKRRTPAADDKRHTPGGDDKHHTPVDDKSCTPDDDKFKGNVSQRDKISRELFRTSTGVKPMKFAEHTANEPCRSSPRTESEGTDSFKQRAPAAAEICEMPITSDEQIAVSDGHPVGSLESEAAVKDMVKPIKIVDNTTSVNQFINWVTHHETSSELVTHSAPTAAHYREPDRSITEQKRTETFSRGTQTMSSPASDEQAAPGTRHQGRNPYSARECKLEHEHAAESETVVSFLRLHRNKNTPVADCITAIDEERTFQSDSPMKSNDVCYKSEVFNPTTEQIQQMHMTSKCGDNYMTKEMIADTSNSGTDVQRESHFCAAQIELENALEREKMLKDMLKSSSRNESELQFDRMNSEHRPVTADVKSKRKSSWQLLLEKEEKTCLMNSNSNVRAISKLQSPDSANVCGVTSLNGRLYILRWRDTDQVDVHSISSDFTLVRHLSLPGHTKHYWNDMTSCQRHNCIYISDYSRRSILRLHHGATPTRWNLQGRPSGLSVTTRYNLLVACPRSQSLLELNTNGDCVRHLDLDGSIHLPWHAVELGRQYVVCYGWTRPRTSGICSVTAEGRIVGDYGGTVNLPCHLAVDQNHSRLFVVDNVANRLLLVTPSLSLGRRVLSLEDRPKRLHLDNTGLLYVADDSGLVTICRCMINT